MLPALDPILGDPKLLPGVLRHEIKGSVLAARARYVAEAHGETALAELVARVPEPARRHLLERPLPFSWYPFAEMIEIDRQIVLGPMQGDVTRMRDFGIDIARYDLSTLYKLLYKVGSPSFILKRVGAAYGKYFRGGSARAEQLADRRVRLAAG